MVQQLEKAESGADDDGSRRVKVTHYMPRDLLTWLRGYCEDTGVAQSRLLTLLVRKYRDDLN